MADVIRRLRQYQNIAPLNTRPEQMANSSQNKWARAAAAAPGLPMAKPYYTMPALPYKIYPLAKQPNPAEWLRESSKCPWQEDKDAVSLYGHLISISPDAEAAQWEQY